MYLEIDCACKGKNLDRMLQPGILLSIYDSNKFGYEITKDLKENPMFAGAIPDKTGVYRYLKRMEESEYLTSEWLEDGEGGTMRRCYSITDKGRTCLLQWKDTLYEYAKSMELFVKKIDKASPKNSKN